MKPFEVAAGCVSLRGKHDQFTVRKIASALRLTLRQTTLEKSCSQSQVPEAHEAAVAGFGSLRAKMIKYRYARSFAFAASLRRTKSARTGPYI